MKRRTVASSSDCNFRGVLTTNADAGSTLTTTSENDKAKEVQTTKIESNVELITDLEEAEEEMASCFFVAKKDNMASLILTELEDETRVL